MKRSQLMIDLLTGGDARLDRVQELLGQEDLEELSALLDDEDDYLRGAAAWALGQLGDLRALPALCGCLGDSDTGVVEMAVWALNSFDDLSATEPLLLLSTSASGHLRALALTALGQLRASAAWPRVLELLDDDFAEARSAAAGAVGDLLDHDPIERERALGLLRALLGDPEPQVVVSVVEVLGEQNDVASLPALIELLSHDESWVRGVTLRALAAIGDKRALAPADQLTADTDPRVRRIAYEALAALQ